jgi:hypothetical protein
MLAQVSKLKKSVTGGLLIAAIISLISCASEKQPVSVVKDSAVEKESAIPWNKQEKWEVGGEMSAMGANSDRAH